MPGSSGGCTVHVLKPREMSGQARRSHRGDVPHWNAMSLAKYSEDSGVPLATRVNRAMGDLQ